MYMSFDPSDPTVPKERDNPAELIADGIQSISNSMQEILSAGLKKKTIVVLVSYDTGLPQKAVSAVLDSLEDLASDWTQ